MQTRLHLADLLTWSRIAAVPVLLAFAWAGLRIPFLVLLAAALLSDLADGYLARRRNTASVRGAALDSWADLILYLSLPLSVARLWPGLLRREAPYIVAALGGFVLPVLVGSLRFGRLPSHHTRLAKISAFTMGFAVFWLLAGGPACPFRIAAALVVLAGIEDVLITFTLNEPRSNVPSFFHARRIRRASNPTGATSALSKTGSNCT